MALIKRSKYWHFDFVYKGVRHQGSTGQTNINKARLALAAIRSNVALEAVGIAPPKVVPMFKDFLETRFLPHVRQHHAAKPRTIVFYAEKVRRLLEYPAFVAARLDLINEDLAAQYAAWRLAQRRRKHGVGLVQPVTVNRELATLRKAILLAFEWQLIRRRPRFHLLPGEKGREFILTGEMENAYVTLCAYPLKQAAILMLDLGLRPDECVSLRKSAIYEGAAFIGDSKTPAGIRVLPLTQRAVEVIQLLCDLWPESEWLFPGRKPGRHLTREALDHQHALVRDRPEFVLYTMRHTFGTRLAESGATPFEICRLMGHKSVTISQRYIHLSASHLDVSMQRKEARDRLLRGETQNETSVSVSRI